MVMRKKKPVDWLILKMIFAWETQNVFSLAYGIEFTRAIKSKMICIYHVLFLHYVSFSNYHNHAYYWLALEDCNESEFDERM